MHRIGNRSVKLGLLTPLSGIVKCYGQEITWAAQIARDIVNERGGVLGQPLDLVVVDDGSVPDTAVPAARSLVQDRKCDAIIGNLLSNSRISVASQVADHLKVPYLNFSFYEGSISSPYFFNFAALPNQQIDKMIRSMVHRHGPKIFFAGSDYEWPRGSIDAAKNTLHRIGGEVVGEEYFALGEADPEKLLSAVARSGADIFVPYFAGHEQIDLLSKFTSLGLKSKMAVVMGHYDEVMASFLPPSVRDGLYSSNSYFMTVQTPENEEYLKRLAAHWEVDGIWPQGNGMLTNFGEGTYVCVSAYAQAVNQAGTLETEAVIEALKHVVVKAPQGKVSMQPDIQHAAVNCYLTRCREDGSFEIVESYGCEKPLIPKRYTRSSVSKFSRTISESKPKIDEDKKQVSQCSGAKKQRILKSQLTAALNTVEIGAIVTSSDGVIVQVNATAEKLFGYQAEEILGLDISVLVPPRFRSQHGGYFRGFASGQIAAVRMGQRGEISGYTKDGREFPAEASITSYDADGKKYFVAMLREISKYKDVEERLQWQATHDPLTKLPNRQVLMGRLSNALQRRQRSGGSLAILFIDLDEFKLINDSYGHSVGDQLLIEVGKRLLKAVRGGDLVARFGGDEFIVLCEKVEHEAAAAFLADRINSELRQPIMVEGLEIFPTCSIGIAISQGGAVSEKDLLSNADAAMYQMKASGRDGWISFNADLQDKAKEKLAIANGLRTAVAKEELHCLYQPIVDTETGQVVGVETLLRWVPETGPVSPADFIPVAEMTGTITELGAWVLEQACDTQVELADLFGNDDCPYVSVNVSPKQLEEPEFFEHLCRISAEKRVNAAKILIEVTETTLMANIDHSLRVLNALGDLGFGIAIDDFGTGYSSLSFLTKMPLTVLKVDRAFVSKITVSQTDLTVATAVVGLAHSLGLKVVAEGVETEEQRELLDKLDTHYCQGYLFAKPLQRSEFIEKYLVHKAASAG